MPEYDVGDRVRIDIPNETNHNHDQYYVDHDTIVNLLEDERGFTPRQFTYRFVLHSSLPMSASKTGLIGNGVH